MGIRIGSRELHRAQGDLTLAGGLVPGDDVRHVVGHEHGRHLRVVTRQVESVAPVELDVLVAERPGGEVVEGTQAGAELGVGCLEALGVSISKGRLVQVWLQVRDVPLVVGERVVGTLVDEGARDGEPGPRLIERGGELLDPSRLRVGAGMSAELEQDQELPHSATMRVAGARGGGRGGIEGYKRVEIQIGSAPVPRDDGVEYGPLLGGGTAVDVERAEQQSGDRLDQGVVDDARHGSDGSRAGRIARVVILESAETYPDDRSLRRAAAGAPSGGPR